MIWPDFLHLALFAAIILHAICDGAMDANAHLRIHLALHPLRDSWHLQKHCSRACLLAIGYIGPVCWRGDRIACAIALICGLVVGRAVWDAAYRCPVYWLALDERVKISTGWKWLDRMLGLHW